MIAAALANRHHGIRDERRPFAPVLEPATSRAVVRHLEFGRFTSAHVRCAPACEGCERGEHVVQPEPGVDLPLDPDGPTGRPQTHAGLVAGGRRRHHRPTRSVTQRGLDIVMPLDMPRSSAQRGAATVARGNRTRPLYWMGPARRARRGRSIRPVCRTAALCTARPLTRVGGERTLDDLQRLASTRSEGQPVSRSRMTTGRPSHERGGGPATLSRVEVAHPTTSDSYTATYDADGASTTETFSTPSRARAALWTTTSTCSGPLTALLREARLHAHIHGRHGPHTGDVGNTLLTRTPLPYTRKCHARQPMARLQPFLIGGRSERIWCMTA